MTAIVYGRDNWSYQFFVVAPGTALPDSRPALAAT